MSSSAYALLVQRSRRFRLELCVADQHEHVGERQAWALMGPNAGGVGRHCRRRSPRRMRGKGAEPIGRPPGEHGLSHLGPPFATALDASLASALSSTREVAVRAAFGERREGRVVARFQRRLLRREEACERRVRGSDDSPAPRDSADSSTVNEERCIATVDAVQRIEDRRVYDGTEPLTGGVRRARRDQRVNEDLVPLEHRVAEGRLFRRLAGRVERTMNQEGQPDEKAGSSAAEGCGCHGIPFHSTPLTRRVQSQDGRGWSSAGPEGVFRGKIAAARDTRRRAN